jgi:Fur family peroxide stress response transcriptional regulator
MHSISQLIQHIHARGGKVTPQRLVLYQLLAGDTSHPTAEALYERIRRVLPTVSLTTVYKTLNELVAMGEVRRFEVHGVSHFDPNTEPHAEAVCLGCGTIIDVAHGCPPAVPSIPDFRIVRQAQTFYGYCKTCQEKDTGG